MITSCNRKTNIDATNCHHFSRYLVMQIYWMVCCCFVCFVCLFVCFLFVFLIVCFLFVCFHKMQRICFSIPNVSIMRIKLSTTEKESFEITDTTGCIRNPVIGGYFLNCNCPDL